MYRPPGVTADGAAAPWSGKRLGRKKRTSGAQLGNDGWKPRPRRLQIEIEPKQVTACPAPFVALAVDAPPALLLGDSSHEATAATATAATSATGVASWTDSALKLTVTLQRSGVYEDDPFVPARCVLELREPVARAHLATTKQPDGHDPSAPPDVHAKPLCVYALDLAQYCDPHSDMLQRELILNPEGRDLRGAVLAVVISSRHCEEVPRGELQRYREMARAGQVSSAQVGELAEQVDMLMSTLETTHANLLAAQAAETQAKQLAERHITDLEDMEEQLKAAESERERLDAEYAMLRSLAALPRTHTSRLVQAEWAWSQRRSLQCSATWCTPGEQCSCLNRSLKRRVLSSASSAWAPARSSLAFCSRRSMPCSAKTMTSGRRQLTLARRLL